MSNENDSGWQVVLFCDCNVGLWTLILCSFLETEVQQVLLCSITWNFVADSQVKTNDDGSNSKESGDCDCSEVPVSGIEHNAVHDLEEGNLWTPTVPCSVNLVVLPLPALTSFTVKPECNISCPPDFVRVISLSSHIRCLPPCSLLPGSHPPCVLQQTWTD